MDLALQFLYGMVQSLPLFGGAQFQSIRVIRVFGHDYAALRILMSSFTSFTTEFDSLCRNTWSCFSTRSVRSGLRLARFTSVIAKKLGAPPISKYAKPTTSVA